MYTLSRITTLWLYNNMYCINCETCETYILFHTGCIILLIVFSVLLDLMNQIWTYTRTDCGPEDKLSELVRKPDVLRLRISRKGTMIHMLSGNYFTKKGKCTSPQQSNISCHPRYCSF